MQAVRERKDTSGTLEFRNSTPLQSNYRRLVMKILVIDLGKFNSVACLFDTTTHQSEFETFATQHLAFEWILTHTQPHQVIIESSCAQSRPSTVSQPGQVSQNFGSSGQSSPEHHPIDLRPTGHCHSPRTKSLDCRRYRHPLSTR